MRKMRPRARPMKHGSQKYVKTLYICGDLDYTRISSSKYMKMYLLRPHPQESDKSFLSITSQIRVQVEQTCLYIVRMIRRRWVSIRQEGGFDNMETWVTAEISDGTGLS